MSLLRPIVDEIYVTLGMAPPVDDPGREFVFDLSGIAIELRVAQDGRDGIMRANIGQLAPTAHTASDQLGRLLRLGLGLVASNGAALEVPGAHALRAGDDSAHRGIYAVSVFPLNSTTAGMDALRAVVEWQSYAETIVGPPGQDDEDSYDRPDAAAADEHMMIFQP